MRARDRQRLSTGAGVAVVDVLRVAGVKPIPVTITGGDQVTPAAGGLKPAEVLRKKLLDFKIRIDPQTAHDSYAAWRAGAHDDLVLAAAAAAWDADRRRRGPCACDGILKGTAWTMTD